MPMTLALQFLQSTPAPSVTGTPLAEAEKACASGSSLCSVVTQSTGSAKAGAWAELLVGTPLHILLILVVAVLARALLHRLIARIVERIAAGAESARSQTSRTWFGVGPDHVIAVTPLARERRAQRARTIGTVLRSVATGVIVVVTVLMALSELGLNIAPLLASAGIVGVAVSFGAQSLVKDFLSGMFMIMEDQYGVGDTVNLGDAIGIVESVGLRVTQVRDTAGVLWYVPNGQIARVGNSSQGWSRAIVDVSIGYGQDTTAASEVLAEVGAQAREDPVIGPLIIEDPEVWGVEQLSANAVVMRMVVKTLPAEQARVGREMRHRAQLALTRAGISPPFMQGRDDPAVLEPPATTKP